MIQKTFREIALILLPRIFSNDLNYANFSFLLFFLSITELCWFKQVCIFTRRRWCWFWRFRIDKEERNTESADTQSEIFRQKERKLCPKNQNYPIICATSRANSNDVVTKEKDDKNDDPSTTTSTTSELQWSVQF